MIRHVRLQRLPDGLKFPLELEGRVKYNADSQQLEFEGYMAKTDFDKLIRLDNDMEYQRALERLFQICVYEEPSDVASPSRRKMICFAFAVLVVLFLVALCSLFLLTR